MGYLNPMLRCCPRSACCRDGRQPPRDPSRCVSEKKESEVAVVDIVPVPGDSFEQTLTAASLTCCGR
jgi:hypothetical protein